MQLPPNSPVVLALWMISPQTRLLRIQPPCYEKPKPHREPMFSTTVIIDSAESSLQVISAQVPKHANTEASKMILAFSHFMSVWLRPQTSRSRDKPCSLCPIQIPGLQNLWAFIKKKKKVFFYATKTCIIHWFQDWAGDRNLIRLKEITHKGLEESEKNVFGSQRKGDLCYVVVESFAKLSSVVMRKL